MSTGLDEALEPIFSTSNSTAKQQATPVASGTSAPPPPKPKVIIKKRADEIGTPSISRALSGENDKEKELIAITKSQVKKDAETQFVDQAFTIEKLHEIWLQMVDKYSDQVHLHNTLLNLPIVEDGNIVVITVENSVQQDKIRLMKPEIIGFLRRSLHNSTIDVRVELNRAENENKILTDEQKIKAMIQKNPALALFKNTFNLDFSG